MSERTDRFGRPLYPWESVPSTPEPKPAPRPRPRRQEPPAPTGDPVVVLEPKARED